MLGRPIRGQASGDFEDGAEDAFDAGARTSGTHSSPRPLVTGHWHSP